MTALRWDASLELGVDSIDRQHKRLVELASRVVDAVRQGKSRESVSGVMTQLREYTVAHFNDEETHMLARGYPGLAAHQQEHKRLVAAVKLHQRSIFMGQLVGFEEVRDLLKAWLLDHILQRDMEYKQWLDANDAS